MTLRKIVLPHPIFHFRAIVNEDQFAVVFYLVDLLPAVRQTEILVAFYFVIGDENDAVAFNAVAAVIFENRIAITGPGVDDVGEQVFPSFIFNTINFDDRIQLVGIIISDAGRFFEKELGFIDNDGVGTQNLCLDAERRGEQEQYGQQLFHGSGISGK